MSELWRGMPPMVVSSDLEGLEVDLSMGEIICPVDEQTTTVSFIWEPFIV